MKTYNIMQCELRVYIDEKLGNEIGKEPGWYICPRDNDKVTGIARCRVLCPTHFKYIKQDNILKHESGIDITEDDLHISNATRFSKKRFYGILIKDENQEDNKKEINRLEKKRLNKLWKQVRQDVLERDKECISCGIKDKQKYLDKKGNIKTAHLNACHILPKEVKIFQYLQYDQRNLFMGCSTCHKFGVFSFHKNPLFFIPLIKKKLPKQYSFLIKELKRLYREYGKISI